MMDCLLISFQQSPFVTAMRQIADQAADINWWAVLVGSATTASIFALHHVSHHHPLLKKYSHTIPVYLIVVLGMTLLSFVVGLHEKPFNLTIQGRIEPGLPAFKLPSLRLFDDLLGAALQVSPSIIFHDCSA